MIKSDRADGFCWLLAIQLLHFSQCSIMKIHNILSIKINQQPGGQGMEPRVNYISILKTPTGKKSLQLQISLFHLKRQSLIELIK